MTNIDASGLKLSPKILAEALSGNPAETAKAHPHMVMGWKNEAICSFTTPIRVQVPPDFVLQQKLHVTVAGIPVTTDASMPRGRLEFSDGKGELVAVIENIEPPLFAYVLRTH